MFTGIVTEVGTIVAVTPTDGGRLLALTAPATAGDLVVGDSVAVNGVCLTALEVTSNGFAGEAVAETLARTTLGDLGPGDRVDLERPLEAAGRFDGHIVQGHVDGVGSILGVAAEGDSIRVRIDVPANLDPYLVEKGSIAVDGVSLTVTGVSEPGSTNAWFEVVLIPHTMAATVLSERVAGDGVNLEVDVIAKYLERWMEART
jgi:riboflavin synthase